MTDHEPLSNADWARAYIERGWNPTPLKEREKAPESNAWQRQAIDPEQVDAVFAEPRNIGLLLGPPSGNLLDIDLDCPATVQLAPHFLRETGTIFGRPSKPNSHYLYQADPSETIRRESYMDPDGTLLMEIRGQGHQTMVPASNHPDGDPLGWSVFGDPARTTVEDLQKRAGWLAAAAMLGRHWHEWDQRRHFIVLHLSGAMLRAGVPVEQVKDFIKAVCLVGGENDWSDREKAVDSTAAKREAGEEYTGFPNLTESIGVPLVSRLIKWLHLPTAAHATGSYTDTANAERLATRHGTDIRYDAANKQWLIWDGARYAVDRKHDIVERMTETVRSIFEEAAKPGLDSDVSKALAKHAAKSLDRPRLESAITLARSKTGIAVIPNELDFDPHLLNVQNGTINLMTGGIEAHDRRNRMTKLAPVTYDPQAEAPVFRAFVNRAMGDDPDLVAFMQRMAGYCLTGDVSEQVFFFLYGDGQNGKSKFVEALFMVMGDYAGKLPPGVLSKRQYGSDPTDFQDLPGRRVAVTNETAKGGVLDDALIKDMTGGDRLVGRKLYGVPFEFDPTHKIIMYGNHKPTFSGTDKGIRRRPILVPFDVTIPEHERDKTLGAQFARELPGILAWAVEGCLAWRHDGLNVPAKIRAATDAYIDEQDPAKRFLDECTVKGDRVERDVLYTAYAAWARQAGEDLKSRRELMKDMTRLGILEIPSNGKLYRKGIRLKGDWTVQGNARRISVVESDGGNSHAAD